jgi:hypothetical protein
MAGRDRDRAGLEPARQLIGGGEVAVDENVACGVLLHHDDYGCQSRLDRDRGMSTDAQASRSLSRTRRLGCPKDGGRARAGFARRISGLDRPVRHGGAGVHGGVDAVAERHGGLPSADSGAMTERADEQSYRTRSKWEQPVTDTHTFGAVTLRAAADYVRGIAELFASDRSPLYAHLTLARAALESAVVLAWLSQPGISTLERIKRGLCELLYSANEVSALQLDAKGFDNVEFWKQVGTAFGWTINNSRTKPIIDGTRRPRISDGVVALSGSATDARGGRPSLLAAVRRRSRHLVRPVFRI